jgi:hypothetical protein
MKRSVLLTLSLMAFASIAQAQASMDASATSPQMPAVATPSSTNPTAPVAGHNSFTQKQAKARIAKAGYTSIGKLTKGDDGIWRTTAKKGGISHHVSLDYQGNITNE